MLFHSVLFHSTVSFMGCGSSQPQVAEPAGYAKPAGYQAQGYQGQAYQGQPGADALFPEIPVFLAISIQRDKPGHSSPQ